MAVASRLQHGVLLPAVLYFAARSHRSARFYRDLALGLAPPLACQAIAWTVVYGSPFGPLVQGGALGGSTWFPFQRTAFLPVLFSSWHGLLSWSPIAGFAVAGWILRMRTDRVLPTTLLLMFAGELVANATFDRYFWGGMSFGARRFVDLAVPFVLGLGWLVLAFRCVFLQVVLSAATAWTVLLAMAAATGSIDLSIDISGAALVRSAFALELSAPVRSPVADPGLLGRSAIVMGIFGVMVPALSWICRSRRRAVIASLIYLLGVAAGLAFTYAPTRARTEAEISRLGIDRTRAARLGPLLDQRKLLKHELVYDERTGRHREAQETTREIEWVERAIAEAQSGNALEP
jgi:hypothetical protein